MAQFVPCVMIRSPKIDHRIILLSITALLLLCSVKVQQIGGKVRDSLPFL